MMDILKPPTVWINGSCYRKNVETDYTPTRGYTGEDEAYDDLDDEVPEDEADSFQHVIEEISGGRYKASLQIASSFFPQIIGKGGQTKSRLEMDTRTKINIPRKGQEGDIVITGSDRRGVINASNRIDVTVAAARNKMSFTHFISLPVNTPSIQEAFIKFRQEVLENCSDVRGVDETIFQTPTLLHLTLGTMALLDERERDLARNLMQDCKEKVLLPLLGEKPLKFEVSGLEYMNDDPAEVDVLYAKVNDEDGTLQAAADGIVNHFIESGLMTRQYDRVKLHVTLMNTLFRKDAGDLGDKNDQNERESFDSRCVFEGWKDVRLGDVEVNEVHLSQRRAGRRTKEEPPTSFVFPVSSPRAKSSTFKQPDVMFPYVWTVANITDKINSTSSTSPADKLQTDFFTIPGDESQWYFDLLPQGLETTGSKKFKGHVVIVLCSKEKFQGKVGLECFVKKHNGRPNTYIKTPVTAGAAKAKKVYPHAHCVAAAGVAHSDLKNPAKLLLKDDQVELYMKITITGEERTVTKIAPLESSMSENDGMTELCGKMVEMWRRQELTDVSVKCGGEVFRCHKLVLAARSPVFKARFETSVKDVGEIVIDIDELEVETVKEMINYMYTGTVKDLKFKASGLLEASDRFNLPGLKAIAEQNIIFNMELHRALDIFLLADRHNAEVVRSAAKEMIVNNCGVVVQQEGWKEKLENHTSLILEIFEAMAESS